MCLAKKKKKKGRSKGYSTDEDVYKIQPHKRFNRMLFIRTKQYLYVLSKQNLYESILYIMSCRGENVRREPTAWTAGTIT